MVPYNLTTNNTKKPDAIIIKETATAASILPTDISKNTVVGKTSVRILVAPAKINIGPNSPKALAQAREAAVKIPLFACGNKI